MSLTHHVLPSCVILYGLVCVLPMGKYAAGSYLRDVELIGPSSQAELNTVYYYPSYVKGEDPVEEYNRRRLHVDTANFMEYETNRPNGVEQPRHNQQRQAYEKPNETDDECCLKVKRKRKYHGQSRYPKQHAIDPMRVVDAQTDHEQNYKKIRQTGAGVPRYVRDDVELFDIERGNRIKAKRPIRRRTRTAHASRTNEQRPRYEESDPQIFAYERSDAIASGRADTDQPRTSQDNQYFQDTFQFQKSPLELEFGHLFESNNGWEERYERQDHQNHRHQGKIR
ncbi:uncharacterized protein LOC125771112 isoform X3 [Anopheles funestus]|uniref:uncharacterized protein LOC125771112 isoform X3 n=1 Tax=Anopheles funestus TaxID=62324 RepID=UPI0020C6118C|nr:uncharacterized protein LOC125771112 isoform X3 [Anopheles funestus]